MRKIIDGPDAVHHDAIVHYGAAVAVDTNHAEAHNNLAVSLRSQLMQGLFWHCQLT